MEAAPQQRRNNQESTQSTPFVSMTRNPAATVTECNRRFMIDTYIAICHARDLHLYISIYLIGIHVIYISIYLYILLEYTRSTSLYLYISYWNTRDLHLYISIYLIGIHVIYYT